MDLVLINYINQTFDEAKKLSLKNKESSEVRKSIKDMTIKYWPYKPLKNIAKKSVIIAGLRDGKICSAFKIDGYNIVDRLNKNNTYSERLEFFATESYDEIVGIDLSIEINLSIGGPTFRKFSLKDIESMALKQGQLVEENRKNIFSYYEELGIPYNPPGTNNYCQHYYGGKGSTYRRSDSVRRNTHKRSNYTCEYCNKQTLDLYCHHIDLLSESGEDIIENTMSACGTCHNYMHSIEDYNTRLKPLLKKIREANQ